MFEIDKREKNDLPYQPYDFVPSIFNDFLSREKEIIRDYWTNEEHVIFFRGNKDTNQKNDNTTIYYPAEDSIKEGRLLTVFGKIYLSLNQETVENSCYKKSDLLCCNIIIDTFSNGKEIVLPAYAYDITSTFGNDQSTISVVRGNVEIITQHCDLAEDITLNSTFNAMGGRYMVTNRTWNSGIIHFFATREADVSPPNYELDVILKDKYTVGTRSKLTTVAKRIELPETDVVVNPTIIWESSDINIVSISKNGTASFNNTGTAEIVAIWREHNIAETGMINVTNDIIKRCEIIYDGLPQIKCGGSAMTFSGQFYDDNNKLDATITPVWSLDLPHPAQENNVVLSEAGDNTIKITAKGKAPTGTSIFLVLADESGAYNARLEIDLIDLF